MADEFTYEEYEAIIRFLSQYDFDVCTTGHQRAQRALLRRMYCDLGVDYGDVIREIVPTLEKEP